MEGTRPPQTLPSLPLVAALLDDPPERCKLIGVNRRGTLVKYPGRSGNKSGGVWIRAFGLVRIAKLPDIARNNRVRCPVEAGREKVLRS